MPQNYKVDISDPTLSELYICMAIMPNLSQKGFLNPALYDPGILWVTVSLQMSSDDGSADNTRSVDDLLDPRDPKSDMYTDWSRRVVRGKVLWGVASIYTHTQQLCILVTTRLGGKSTFVKLNVYTISPCTLKVYGLLIKGTMKALSIETVSKTHS